jgi:hypothetical protein
MLTMLALAFACLPVSNASIHFFLNCIQRYRIFDFLQQFYKGYKNTNTLSISLHHLLGVEGVCEKVIQVSSKILRLHPFLGEFYVKGFATQ